MSFDFDAAVSAPCRMQPGLRRLAPGTPQLTPVAPGSRHQREKLAVLSAFADQALVSRPGFDAAPALDALCRHAAAEHAAHWRWDGRAATAPRLGVRVDDGRVEQLGTGAFGLGDEVSRCVGLQPPAWRLPALLALAFAEDFAIVDASDTTVPWMAVALPSHWAPEDKVGQPLASIHAPVADAERVRQGPEALTRRVADPERWERFIWNVTDHPRLHAHPRRVPRERWTDGDPDVLSRAWFRSERQTFVPVAGHPQSVLTIAVDMQPLDVVIDGPQRAQRLAEAIAGMSPTVLEDRGLAPVRERLLTWLAAR